MRASTFLLGLSALALGLLAAGCDIFLPEDWGQNGRPCWDSSQCTEDSICVTFDMQQGDEIPGHCTIPCRINEDCQDEDLADQCISAIDGYPHCANAEWALDLGAVCYNGMEEDICGTGNLCVPFTLDEESILLCSRTCSVDGDCPSPYGCDDISGTDYCSLGPWR